MSSATEDGPQILKIIQELYSLAGVDGTYTPQNAHLFGEKEGEDCELWREEHAMFQSKGFTKLPRGMVG